MSIPARGSARKWRRIPGIILLVCLIVYAAVAVLIASRQRRFIYFPPVLDAETVSRLGEKEQLERWTSPSGKQVGWKRLSPSQPAQGQVLVTHGNAGCAFQCRRYPDVIQQVAPLDVFLVEYPGYADCAGQPTEHTLEKAAEEALELLATNSPVYLLGESLGTGVAAYLAGVHSNRVAGVVLLAPYDSLVSVAQEHMRLLPVSLMLVDRFPAEEYLRNYHGPLAVLVAGQDQVIPKKFGRRLYESYTGPKRLWEFPQGNHGTVMQQPPEIWQQIIDFWQTNTPASNAPTVFH